MKILVVTPDFGMKGTQRVAENFIRAFASEGHAVEVFPFRSEGPRRAAIVRAGAVIVDDVGPASYDLVHIHRSGVTSERETRLLQELRPRAKVVLETNVFARYDPSTEGLIDLHGQLTRIGLHRFRCLSPKVTHGIPFVLPNAVDFTPFSPVSAVDKVIVRRGLGLPEHAPIIGRIGKTDASLFESLGRLLRRHSELCVASVGDHPALIPLRDEFEHRVHVLPATDDDAQLARYYQSFDVLAHLSKNGESFGMVLAEAMACGIPVVMPLRPHRDLGGAEVIRNGQGGIICGSLGDLEQVIERLLEGTGMPLDTAGARQRLLRDYDFRHVAQRALDMALEFAGSSPLAEARAALGETVSPDEVAWLLGDVVGRVPLHERMLHVVAHDPKGAALVRVIKGLWTPR